MVTSLNDLITTHWETLADAIVKEAICQIPSYGEAPLRLTIERIERWLRTLAESISQNNPPLLAGYLIAVAEERRAEGYPIGDVHAIVYVTERHLRNLIARSCPDQVERDSQTALLTAIMDSARMTLSVTYILNMATRELRRE